MPPNNLVQQLGEISGQLSHVVPALERMETRLTEMGRELTEAQTNIKNLSQQLDGLRESTGEQNRILSTDLRTAAQTNADQAKEIEALKKQVDEKKKRGWDVALVVISVALTAFVTWLITHVSAKGS